MPSSCRQQQQLVLFCLEDSVAFSFQISTFCDGLMSLVRLLNRLSYTAIHRPAPRIYILDYSELIIETKLIAILMSVSVHAAAASDSSTSSSLVVTAVPSSIKEQNMMCGSELSRHFHHLGFFFTWSTTHNKNPPPP